MNLPTLFIGSIARHWPFANGGGRLIDRMESLAKGDLAAPIPYGDDRYELGKLASAIGVFRSTLMEVEWPAAGLMTRHLPSFGIGQGAKLC